MNLLGWIFGIGILLLLLAQAVVFHKSTVCRQKAWAKSFEVYSRSLIKSASSSEVQFIPHCQILVHRRGSLVRWNQNSFEMELKGSL